MSEKILFFITRILSILFLISFVLIFSIVDYLPFSLFFIFSIILFLSKDSEKIKIFKESLTMGYFTNFQYSVRIVGILLFFVGVGFLVGAFGITTIYETINNLLQSCIFFRYAVYGLLLPISFTYFLTWCISSYRPVTYGLNSTCFIVVSFILMFLGLFICIDWENYYIINNEILNRLLVFS